jgi:hypothetical protein
MSPFFFSASPGMLRAPAATAVHPPSKKAGATASEPRLLAPHLASPSNSPTKSGTIEYTQQKLKQKQMQIEKQQQQQQQSKSQQQQH